MQRIALFLALVLLSAWPAAIALGQPPIPYGTQLPPDAIAARPNSRHPLPGQTLQARAALVGPGPAAGANQAAKRAVHQAEGPEDRSAQVQIPQGHERRGQGARRQVSEAKARRARYPEQSFPRDYRELYASDVADLPGDPNYYTMRVDYVVELKNSPVGAAGQRLAPLLQARRQSEGGGQHARGARRTASSEGRRDEWLDRPPHREQLKKEAAELKEMKRKPAKPEKEKTGSVSSLQGAGFARAEACPSQVSRPSPCSPPHGQSGCWAELPECCWRALAAGLAEAADKVHPGHSCVACSSAGPKPCWSCGPRGSRTRGSIRFLRCPRWMPRPPPSSAHLTAGSRCRSPPSAARAAARSTCC